MARLNHVQLIGKIESKSEIRKIKADNEIEVPILNFVVSCEDLEDKRKYKIPIALWNEEAYQMEQWIRTGDYVYINGEMRYKFIKNGNKIEKIYTNVKANTIELITKQIKNPFHTPHYVNEVKLMGNIVNGDKNNFIIAVDRLPKETPDFITITNEKGNAIKGNFKKGSFVILDGKIATRKKENVIKNLPYSPTIIVTLKDAICY